MKTLKHMADLVGAAFGLSLFVVISLTIQLPWQQFILLGIFLLITVSMCVVISQAVERKMATRTADANDEVADEHIG